MPMPVSSTSNFSCTACADRERMRTRTAMLPRGVNFTALAVKFSRICPSRSGSPRSVSAASSCGRSTEKARPLSRACCSTMATSRSSQGPGWKSIASRSSRSASIFDRSRMLLISSSRCCEARSTLASCSRSWASCERRISSPVMPMMALSGVRSSWLMLARKTLLARLLASAASLACRSSSWLRSSSAVRSRTRVSRPWRYSSSSASVRRRSVMSICTPSARRGRPCSSLSTMRPSVSSQIHPPSRWRSLNLACQMPPLSSQPRSPACTMGRSSGCSSSSQ